MAASSLAPHEYRPNRETPWMAVGLIGLAAVFGLWKGFATQMTAERIVSPQALPADASSPRAARALPAVAASADTLIPPEAGQSPVVLTPAAAPPAVAVSPSTEPPVAAPADQTTMDERPRAEADAPARGDPDRMTPDDKRFGPPPSLQVIDEDDAPYEEEPPPEDVDPYD